jgi:hypothetical protein
MKYIPFAVILFVFVACSKDARQKRRAERKIEAARRLDPSRFENDTITVFDTVVFISKTVDTVTLFQKNDTITVINSDSVILKYFYNTKTNNIYHEATCIGDTVVVENKVIVEKIKIMSFSETLSHFGWRNLLLCALLLLFILLSVAFVTKR